MKINYYARLTGLFLVLVIIWSTEKPQLSAYEFPASNLKQTRDEPILFLQKVSEGLTHVVAKAKGAVVYISVSKSLKGAVPPTPDPFEFFFGVPPFEKPRQSLPNVEQEVASGFIVDLKHGYVMTNNHVVEDANEIQLKLANGRLYTGAQIGNDPNTDIAILKINEKFFERAGLSALSFADDKTIAVGELIIALGAPFGLEASVSLGIIAAVERGSLGISKLGNFIQTDAVINPGNSGGPLLNTHGEVIGVSTAIYSGTGLYNGIGFAIPASLAKPVGERLIAKGEVKRGYIGVSLQSLDPLTLRHLRLPLDTEGVLVAAVDENAPAMQAGVLPGDVILSFNGLKVRDIDEIANSIGLLGPGSKAKLEINRKGQKKLLEVQLREFPL